MKNRDLVTLGILAALAWFLAWLFRNKLTPVVTSKILPAPTPSLEIVSGRLQGPLQLKDIVIGDALPAWGGVPVCPGGYHSEFDPNAGRNVCIRDGWNLKDLQSA